MSSPARLESTIFSVVFGGIQIDLGFVFLLAMAGKLIHPLRFRDTFRDFRLMPERLAGAGATVVIFGEMTLTTMFLSGVLLQVALWFALILLGFFLAAVLIALHQARRIRCGCFGRTDEMVSQRTVCRLALLLAAVVTCAVLLQRGALPTRIDAILVHHAGLANSMYTLAFAVALWVYGVWVLRIGQLRTIMRRKATLHRPATMATDSQRG